MPAGQFTFDGFDFSDFATYFVDDATADIWAMAPVGHTVVSLGSQPGGAVLLGSDGPRTINVGGTIKAGLNSGAFQTARDAMLMAFRRPKRRLTTSPTLDRYCIATCMGVPTKADISGGPWSATFVSEDAYESAIAPTADFRSGAQAALPGLTGSWGSAYTLTPGGSARTPLRMLVMNSGSGPAITLVQVMNVTTGETFAASLGLAARHTLLIDPRQGAYQADGTALTGFWPLLNPTAPLRDFSSYSRDLTRNGTPTLVADGPQDRCAVSFPGTASNNLTATDTAFALTTFSVMFWLRADSLAAAQQVASKAALNTGWGISLTTTPTIRYAWGSGSATGSIESLTTPVVGRWYFVVVTHSTTNARTRLYVGTERIAPALEIAGTNTPALATSTAALAFGGGVLPDGTSTAFAGDIAEPAVIGVELTSDQIARVWQRGPQAYNDQPADWLGTLPALIPGEGATNTLQFRVDAATAPTLRVGTLWRARWY